MQQTIEKITPTTPEAYQLIHDGLLAFAEASRQGVHLNIPYLKKQNKRLKAKIKISRKKFKNSKTGKLWKRRFPNMNYDSGPQMQSILFDNKNLGLTPTKFTEKENASVDNEVLTDISKEYPEFKHLLNAKVYTKALEKLQGFMRESVDGVMHPSYGLHTVQTFRSSSFDPNF